MKIFLFTLLASLAFVVACSSDSPEELAYKQELRDYYMEGCIIGARTNDEVAEYFDYCSCASDYIIDNFSVEEILDQDFLINIANPKATAKCIDKAKIKTDEDVQLNLYNPK